MGYIYIYRSLIANFQNILLWKLFISNKNLILLMYNAEIIHTYTQKNAVKNKLTLLLCTCEVAYSNTPKYTYTH